MPPSTDRFEDQQRLPFWGAAGQARLSAAAVLVAGCGGLGGHAAGLLVRAGVGRVVVADRDAPELANLHRQVMFDEHDVRSGRSKAEITAARLAAVDRNVVVQAHTVEINGASLESLLAQIDLVVDATDNFPTRDAINTACLRRGLPWVHGGAVGTSGTVMTLLPGRGPCLRCVLPTLPDPATAPTTARDGVLNTLPAVVAALQVTQALRVLLGLPVDPGVLRHFDVWENTWDAVTINRNPRCPACGLLSQ